MGRKVAFPMRIISRTMRVGRCLAMSAIVGVLAVGCSGEDSLKDQEIAGTWVPQEVPSEVWGPDFDPASATVTFEEDGTWSASDGCNTMVGHFDIDGYEIELSTGSFAGGECLGGKVSYDEIFPDAERVEASGNELEFFDDSDELLLRLSRQKPPADSRGSGD